MRTFYGRWSGRPRRVTVFAERVEQTGAAQPQKQRRASTPALVVRFVRSFTFASPSLRGHAACSGRLSRCPTFRSGKRRARAPRKPQRNDIAFAARRPTPRTRRRRARGSSRRPAARHAVCRRARKGMRQSARQTSRHAAPSSPVVSAVPASRFRPSPWPHVRRLWLRLRPPLKLSWPAAPWLRAFPRARVSQAG